MLEFNQRLCKINKKYTSGATMKYLSLLSVRKDKMAYLMSWLILLCALIYDVILLNKYAFDLPFWDVWENLPQGNFDNAFNFFNENLQLFYNIISEIMYLYADWNLRYFSFVNFAIYLCLIGVYVQIVVKSEIKISFWPLFFLPLLSPILGYNWLWSILVQTHTYILFFLLAVYFGFCTNESKSSFVLFICSLFLSILSMNLPLALGTVLAYIVKEMINMAPQIKQNTIRKILFLLLLFALFLTIIWFKKDSAAVKEVRLINVFSWYYLSNLSFYVVEGVSLFSLTEIISPKYCPILLLVMLVFLCVAFFEQYKNKKFQALWAIIFSVMLNVCAVVALRHGEVYSYKVSFIRHHEVLFLLLPAILMVLYSSKFKIVKVYSVIVFCQMLYGYGITVKEKQFQFFGELFYKNACLCLNHYYNLKTTADWACTMNYPIPVDSKIEYAKEHNLSFVNNISKCHR